MPAVAGLVVSQSWQYQGHIDKMTVPMVISIKNNEILYLNQYGIEILEKFQNSSKKNTGNFSVTEFKENELLISDEKSKKQILNTTLESLFNSLVLENVDLSPVFNENNTISLSQIIRDKMSSNKDLTNVFEKIKEKSK